jgi:hypothetical protein
MGRAGIDVWVCGTREMMGMVRVRVTVMTTKMSLLLTFTTTIISFECYHS